MSVLFPWLLSIWLLASWACVWVVNLSCVFVYLTGTFLDELENPISSIEDDAAGPPRIERGIDRGQWLPTDSCQNWNRQLDDEDDVKFDAKILLARITSAASIGLGFIVWLYSMMMAISITRAKQQNSTNHNSQSMTTRSESSSEKEPSMLSSCWKVIVYSGWVQHLSMFLSIIISGFQAATHLMVKSDFCENADPLTFTFDNGQVAVYDSCEKNTAAYNLTFATMAMFMLGAIGIGCLPYPANTTTPMEENLEENEDMDTIPEAQVMEIVNLGPREEEQAVPPPENNDGTPSEVEDSEPPTAAAGGDSFHEEEQQIPNEDSSGLHVPMNKEVVIIDGP